ncbi:hypothetical protein ACQEVG_05280 [Streptomyces sp. CA-135486]|uniref:hypothetical protein n=1 Tax=Streptomyces sp. CA-135486 TaxID=3240049 RepID=UPI003D8BE9FC
MTRPAPSRLRPDAPVELPELRTDTDRVEVLLPVSERESRPETERREVDERDEAREERELLRAELEPRPPPVMPVGGEDTMPLDETTGASPQVSQYSSPLPMSS